MDQWRKDARKEPIIIDIDSLVPAKHLLRKIKRSWIISGCMRDRIHTTAMTMAAPERIRLY